MNKIESKPIYGGKYTVASDGRVFSNTYGNKTAKRLRIKPMQLKLIKNRDGYLIAQIYFNKKYDQIFVHRLVLQSFVGKCPKGLQCAHLDGKRDNNNLANLMWVTPKENCFHKKIHGTDSCGEKNPSHKLKKNQIIEIRESFLNKKNTAYSLAKKYKVWPRTIYKIINRESWSHVK